jgi:Holliday junction resolvase RusA-like endonuclease
VIRFSVPGPPHGKGRPRFVARGGRVRTYTDEATAAYEDRVALHARTAMGLARPLEGPVRVEIVAYRARPKAPGPSHECRAGVQIEIPGVGLRRLCTAKPDADNVVKAVWDGCTLAGLWFDDVQVATHAAVKVWADEGELPRTDVAVEVLR